MIASLVSRAAAMTAVTVAAVHIATMADHFKKQPYVGGLFLGLVAGMAWTALALWERHDDALAWSAGATMSVLAAIGFVFSRTFGIPWFNPAGKWVAIGIASLVVEGLFVGLFCARLMMAPNAGKLSWRAGIDALRGRDPARLADGRGADPSGDGAATRDRVARRSPGAIQRG